jgi:hypothetical protein
MGSALTALGADAEFARLDGRAAGGGARSSSGIAPAPATGALPATPALPATTRGCSSVLLVTFHKLALLLECLNQ